MITAEELKNAQAEVSDEELEGAVGGSGWGRTPNTWYCTVKAPQLC